MTSPSINLQQQLQDYELAAHSRKAGKSATEWTAYAAAAGASLGMAGAADAAIIYSGVQNVGVSVDPTATVTGTNNLLVQTGTGIDIDNDATPDVTLALQVFAGVDTTNPATTFKYLGYAVAGPTGGAAMLQSGGLAVKLASGSLIGPGGSFGGAANGRLFIRDQTTSGTVSGNFNAAETVFLGLQLASGNYGWIRLVMEDLGPNQPLAPFSPPDTPVQDGTGFFDRITAIDWAFQDDGNAIAAGDIGAPAAVSEPSPLALLAAGAVGVGVLRRRQRPAAR